MGQSEIVNQKKTSFAKVQKPIAKPSTSVAGFSSAAIQRAMADPRSLPPNAILQLQRNIGNRAVQRLLNPAQRSAPPIARPAQKGAAPSIQRKMAFKPDDLHDSFSFGGQYNKTVGVQTNFARLKELLAQYEKTNNPRVEVKLLERMEIAAETWLKYHDKNSQQPSKKSLSVKRLLTAINAELLPARAAAAKQHEQEQTDYLQNIKSGDM